ncbi:Lrp/AsnC family transcriptional regulator [Desulfovibrio oxyclinae]|uniref:siroheme decarboxylase subunit beta n=1 Tax=Desulfovibrio oxyclinae TaxID=63560 RepID=UPI000590ABFA|nr:Lrp/AsnC family transcriptional regulator [Desulfovibrio oxyclinae]
MAMQFTEKEERILALAGGDIPDGPEPFKAIAEAAGADEAEVISLLKTLKARGVIRRFGATLRHQKAGYGHNAMVAWKIPDERVDEAGEIFSSCPAISHCYVRRTYPEWQYNFYTMIHGKRPGETDEIVADLEKKVGITDHCTLRSLRELKKTSMVYFKYDKD